ncbi:MAG: hypothetical protein JWM11_5047 [Planctomycetaceae bacterium]|nr:hypothetical protein [Planctomycetaceae bacterium]
MIAKAPIFPTTRRKRLLFLFGATVLGWILLEGLSWCAVRSIEHKTMLPLRAIQQELVRSSHVRASEAESIHPYLGWVSNPQLNTGTTLFDRTIPVNSLGFDDEEHGILKRSPGHFIVGITGGSVAWQMSVAGEKALRQALLEHPRLKDKQIKLVRLAKSGYKQPQQVLALNFALVLGNEFDAVVNIDGYNEIALSAMENDIAGVFAAYPRSWHARMQYAIDPRNHATAFQLLRAKGLKQQIAQERLDSWLHWSPTLNLIWWARHNAFEREILQLSLEFRDRQNTKDFGFAIRGPQQLYSDELGMYAHLVDIWSNSSLQMHQLCIASKCSYTHILQPNQYFPNSKPMGPAERKIAVVEGQKNGKSIAKGYPMLIAQGQKLQQQNLDFHDLTQLFSQVSDPIYVDFWCHYNQTGCELLAREVAKRILANLDRQN